MSRIAVHFSWSLLALVLLSPGLAGAGDTPDFSDRLDVRVVTLDVLVGDRKGRAIRGLTRDDFKLSVDGVAMPISNFSELGAADGQEPAGTPLRLVIYVDNGNLEPHQRKQVLDSLKGFLGEQLDGRNQMMLASGDRFRFDATGGFSKSPEVLLAQLQRIQETAAAGTRNTDFRDIFRDIEQAIVTTASFSQASAQGRVEMLLARIRAFASESHAEVARTSANLQRLVGAMAGLPGRKALLYIGGGISLNPGQVLFSALQNAFARYTQNGESDPTSQLPAGIFLAETRELNRLGKLASINRVAFYAIDASGLADSGSFSVARGPVEVSTGASPAREDAWSPGSSSGRRADMQSSLRMLAAQTGGLALVNSRQFDKALGELAGDFTSYYSIGFETNAEAGAEAEPARLEVSVDRKGARVRHRRSYRFKDSDEIAADRTSSALAVGAESNRLKARLEIGETRPAAGGKRLVVPISIQIPLAEIAVRAQGREHTGQLSVFFATGRNKLPDGPVRKAVFPVRIPNDEILAAMGRILDYRLDLEMPPGKGRIAIGIRDDLDPQLSTVTVDVDLPSAGSSR